MAGRAGIEGGRSNCLSRPDSVTAGEGKGRCFAGDAGELSSAQAPAIFRNGSAAPQRVGDVPPQLRFHRCSPP
jgi:hypothetical protein